MSESMVPMGCKLEKVVSRDGSRHVLQHPFVKDGVLYATDGVMGVAVDGVKLSDGRVPVKALRDSRNVAKGERGHLREADGWIEVGDDVKVRRRGEDSKYPMMDLVFPSVERDRSMRINGARLIRLIQAMGGGDITFHFTQDDVSAPLCLTSEVEGFNVRGVIMPLRERK